MSSQKSNSRRKVLIGLGTGVVGATQLPKSWTKPVVDAVVLPVHAATTDDSGTLPPESTTTLAPGSTTTLAPISSFSGSFDLQPMTDSAAIEDVLSILVPNAYAVEVVPIAGGQMCIDTSSAPVFSTEIKIESGEEGWYFSGGGEIGGGPSSPLAGSDCNPTEAIVTLSVTSASAAGAVYVMNVSPQGGGAREASGTLPVGSNCPTAC